MSQLEEDLLRALDAHDALVAACARGELTWSELETAYDDFYPGYPLDGHEGAPEDLLLLEKHAGRIELHRQVWNEVLTKVTGEEHVLQPGFIGSAEAVRRIQALAATYLTL